MRILIATCALTMVAPIAHGQRGAPAARSSIRVSPPRSATSPYHSTYRPYYRNRQEPDWPLLLIVFLGIPVTAATSIGLYTCWRNRTVGWVRIVDVPRGEAPLEIREAWVGALLPLRSWETQPGTVKSGSMLTPGGPVLDDGYAVAGRAAIQALGRSSPAAAAWWRANASQVLESGYRFVFPVEVCERVSQDRGDMFQVPEPSPTIAAMAQQPRT
jgi:hypothetical protein